MNNIFIDCGTHLGEGLKKHIKIYNIDQTWDVYSFEANPHTFSILENIRQGHQNLPKDYEFLRWSNIKFFNKAISTIDERINFYCSSVPSNLKLDGSQKKEFENFISEHDEMVKNEQLLVPHLRFGEPIDGSSSIFGKLYERAFTISGNGLQRNLEWNTKVEVNGIDFSEFLKKFSSDDYIVCKMDIEGAEYDVLEKCIENKSYLKIKELIIEFHDYLDFSFGARSKKIVDVLTTGGVKVSAWE